MELTKAQEREKWRRMELWSKGMESVQEPWFDLGHFHNGHAQKPSHANELPYGRWPGSELLFFRKTCGTTGCLAGWAPSLEECTRFIRPVLFFSGPDVNAPAEEMRNFKLQPVPTVYYRVWTLDGKAVYVGAIYEAVQIAFGLEEIEANWFCMPGQYEEDNWPTDLEGAKLRLALYVKHRGDAEAAYNEGVERGVLESW